MTPSIYPFSRESDLEQCRAFVAGHLRTQALDPAPNGHLSEGGPAITLTHEVGAGAHTLAPRLAARLDALSIASKVPWTVFDRDLLDRVIREHGFLKFFRKVVPEEHRTYVRDVLEELLGLRPPSWEYVPKVAETILHLAWAGNAVIVGHGANFITAALPNVLHIHLCAEEASRERRMQNHFRWSSGYARDFVRKTDRDYRDFVRQHFGLEADDLHHFDLVLRTDRLGLDLAEDIAFRAASQYFESFSGGPDRSAETESIPETNPYELPTALLR